MMSGNVSIFIGNDSLSNWVWGTSTGAWSGSFQYEGAEGWCYYSAINAHTSDVAVQTAYGDQLCIRKPTFHPPQIFVCESPIVIDFGGATYRISSADEGVRFDITGDGAAETVAWPTALDVAFLFADRNGNGLPDDGSELFGTSTLLRDGTRPAHGFIALAEFDSDGDAAVTPADRRWSDLRLWFDRDRNGQAVLTEVVDLDSAGLVNLEVAPIWTGRRDRHGNQFRWQAQFTATSRGGTAIRGLYYDVFLTYQP